MILRTATIVASERAYFAYGSNLHPLRIIDRLGSKVRFLGVSQADGYHLEFSKRSTDGSAKCTISRSLTGSVWGAVYAISHEQKAVLDKHEGLGTGYDEKLLMLTVAGEPLQAFTYVANNEFIDRELKPYCWYRSLVIAGARHHDFPDEYISLIDEIAFVVDSDATRKLKMENLLTQLVHFSRS